MDTKLNAGMRTRVLLIIALIFHTVGLVGIGLLHSENIQQRTPMHLSLMCALLLLSFRDQAGRFAIWAAITAIITFWAEWIGVHTGLLFGDYSYGAALGLKVLDIPLLIGINWAVVTAGACSIAAMIVRRRGLQVPLAALLATGYDWVMEPVAIRLDYWSWSSGAIPLFNYVCWAGLAAVFAGLWQIFAIRGNIFAAGLFVIQLVFFILLRFLL